MIKTNKKMEEVLLKLKKFNRNEVLSIRYKELIELLYPSFVQVEDCIIISKGSKSELERLSERDLKDKVLFEHSENEIPVTLCFESKISRNASIVIGLKALKSWGAILKKMEPKSKFWMILSVDRRYVTIRFHKLRLGEDLIFGTIDDIEQPVYCELIE